MSNNNNNSINSNSTVSNSTVGHSSVASNRQSLGYSGDGTEHFVVLDPARSNTPTSPSYNNSLNNSLQSIEAFPHMQRTNNSNTSRQIFQSGSANHQSGSHGYSNSANGNMNAQPFQGTQKSNQPGGLASITHNNNSNTQNSNHTSRSVLTMPDPKRHASSTGNNNNNSEPIGTRYAKASEGSKNIDCKELIGKGRDGLIYSFIIEKEFDGWYGWVIKVPRFRIRSLPQPYARAVLSSLPGAAKLTKHSSKEEHSAFQHRVTELMIHNFNVERKLQSLIWKFLSHEYIESIGLPHNLTWEPTKHAKIIPEHLLLTGKFDDDGIEEHLNDHCKTEHCLIMPFAIMDGFQALVHHFSEDLMVNFLSDILEQLKFLEDNNIVHGDFKLSNILLFNWGTHGYIFVLADFWDSFSVNPDGSVFELQGDHPLRRLQRWKFTTEKFGTRLYKDPELLGRLRDTKSGKFKNLTVPHAGKVNLWSFGVIVSLLLLPRAQNESIKSSIKLNVMHSGRNNPEKAALSPEKAIEGFRELLVPSLDVEVEQSRRESKKSSKRISPKNEGLLARLKLAIVGAVLKESSERWSVNELINYLDIPRNSNRNIRKDLGFCKRQKDCSLCKQKGDQN